jgi:hypothetical protein
VKLLLGGGNGKGDGRRGRKEVFAQCVLREDRLEMGIYGDEKYSKG